MTDDEFQMIAARGRESRNLEFKSGGPISNNHLLRRVIRAVLGMTNTRDGGIIILGVEERIGLAEFVGMDEADALTWSMDSFGDKVASWVDRAVSVDIDTKRYQDRYFVVIEVAEFEDTPVFARKDYRLPGGDMVLREGALYVRGSRKPETVEVRNSVEMHRLLELALEKRLLRFGRHARLAGLRAVEGESPTDDELFARQLRDFPT